MAGVDAGMTPSDAAMAADMSANDQNVPVDTGTGDAGCVPTQGGIHVPMGTMASGVSCCSWPPSNAIDDNTVTWWDSGGYSGSLTLTFPSPQTIKSVHLVAESWPASTEQYTIYGLVGNTPTMIGSSSQSINADATPTVLMPIAVTPGSYDGLRFDVSSDKSWIGINEVTLGTASCP
jgi:hypothetical protein